MITFIPHKKVPTVKTDTFGAIIHYAGRRIRPEFYGAPDLVDAYYAYWDITAGNRVEIDDPDAIALFDGLMSGKLVDDWIQQDAQ